MSRAGEKYRIKGIPRGCRLGGLPALDNSFGRSATEIAARGLVLAREDKSSTGLIQDASLFQPVH